MASTDEAAASKLAGAIGTIREMAHNTTTNLVPSAKDLLMLVPRMAFRAGSFVTEDIPGAFENMFGGPITGRIIAEATGERGGSIASAAAAAGATIAASAEGLPGQMAAAVEAGNGGFIQLFSFQQLRTFGGIFTYITSKWALGCFIAAIVLNRTAIYASARRNLHLNWYYRLALRIIPIALLAFMAKSLLQAMRCQTSPKYSMMRYGVPDKYVGLDFSEDGGLLHGLSSSMLFWEDELESCLAVGMITTDEVPEHFPRGSLSLLWPSFQSFCFAQFVETLLCSLQGQMPLTETGMSIFEHSLAFAEAEAMVSSQIGLSPFGQPSNGSQFIDQKRESSEATVLVTKNFIVSRFNTPPEVLLMALISCLNNLSSQILGVFGEQAKYRLINTGIWGMSFMASFAWGALTFSVGQGINAGIFRFPTVCVVGFIPHILILLGILLCASIYFIALTVSALSPPEGFPRNVSWRQRFEMAHENMQANIPLSGLRINWREDFYSALLRIGFTALTAASEAVFLNEGRRINVGHWTWLEEERMEEIVRLQSSFGPSDNDFEGVANGVILSIPDEDTPQTLFGQTQWQSGYHRERSTKVLKGGKSAATSSDGVGAHQRAGRYKLAFVFLSRILWLLTGWLALFLHKVLDRVGINNRPRWLNSLVTTPKPIKVTETPRFPSEKLLEFWILSDQGELTLPQNDNVDVEVETKRRLQLASRSWGAKEEDQLESTLYSWFTSGGWWGDRDMSGDFKQSISEDDDITSVISTTETSTDFEWESDSDGSLSDGRCTPTQTFPFASTRSREPTPTHDLALDPQSLARLLNPQDSEARAEARMLSAHLRSPAIITRSQYRDVATVVSGSQVLTSTRYRPAGFTSKSPNGKLTPAEEAEVLELLLIKFRERGRKKAGSGAAWADGGEGLGAGGPKCVVCQDSARTILAWPCRCLSLCEDCRVSLAMNNFATCVCCRQEVVGFSRLYVP